MKKESEKKRESATTLIGDLQNVWSKFEFSQPDKCSMEKKERTIIRPKKIKKIIPKDNPIIPPPEVAQNSQIKFNKKKFSPKYFLGQGLNFYNQGSYKKAINCFQIVLIMDPNNKESKNYLTKARAKLVKSDNEEFKGDVIEDYLINLTAVESINQKKMKNGNVDEKIKPMETHDNDLVNFTTNYLVENIEKDNFGIEGIIGEITKRRNIEEKLRLLSSAVKQSTEGIAVSNMDGDLLFVNDAFADMHGYESKNIIGENMSTFQVNKEKLVNKTTNKQNENSGEFLGEAWHVKRDGTKFPTYTHTTLFKDELGNPIGMIVTHRDITKLKWSEEEIRKLSSAVEQSIDGIAIGDLNLKLTYVNDAFARIHGYSPRELIGIEVEQLQNKTNTEIFKKGMNKVKTEGSWGGEIECVKKDGNTFPSYMSISLLKDTYGNPIGFLAITKDITISKQMEEELKNYTEHLEEEVKKRTYELIQAEKMVSLGQLVAGVAHEINNPLGYVNSNTEIIAEYIQSLKSICKGKKAKTYLQDINNLLHTNLKGIFRIAETTKSLERFAIPYKGEKAIADINQGIKDTLFFLSNQLKHRIKIHEDYGNIPKIICSIGQLNQVFTNIIQNASEAMEKGNIWIKTSRINNDIIIEITDDGNGISKDIINKIFNPFFTTKEGCRGLGLSLSYRIIQTHDGDIKIKSEVKKGTKITINLPMVSENE